MLRILASTAGVFAVLSASFAGPDRSVSAKVLDTPHSYFDALVERPEHWKSFSLRDARQLQTRANGGYAYCNSCPLAVTYDPANDSDYRRQDAAKVVIPAGKNNLPNQVRLPLGTSDGSLYFITWDVWFGQEFEPQNTGISNHKTFQISSNDSLWFEIQSRWNQGGRDGLAQVTGRAYTGNRQRDEAIGPNVQGLDPLMPMVGSFVLKEHRWTRYWAVIDQRAADYDLTSLWVADETTNPVQLLDKLQLNAYAAKLDSFWIEFNTSTDTAPLDRGPLIAYIRNIAVLRDVVNPASLMQRPNAGLPLPPPPPPLQRPAAPKNLRIILPPRK
jgi:hypothetical protein